MIVSSCKIDLTAHYNQVCVADKDIPKTVFRKKYSTYKHVIMNFGMTNTPSTFVTLMNSVFWPLIGKSVVIYLDNIIVFSKSSAQHKLDLRNVFNILGITSYMLCRPSANFVKRAWNSWGHIIIASGIKLVPERINQLFNCPALLYIQVIIILGFSGLC